MIILGIESSCDESALALFDSEKGMMGEWIHTQLKLHEQYGGVVPALASREHLENFPHLLSKVQEALNGQKLDQIAVTYGPGLAGCLALGVSLAKALALSQAVPLLGVNHLGGHAFSPFISLHEEAPQQFTQKLQSYLPHLGFLVSGGNTILFQIDEAYQLSILAETVDDAAGECLDKGARMLGITNYPGGPHIERLAQTGNAKAFDFPQAFPSPKDLKFSFSGVKTSMRYLLDSIPEPKRQALLSDLCASYQHAVISQLIRKTRHILASGKTYQSLGLSGGVANNNLLRRELTQVGNEYQIPTLLAKKQHTGDNAGMIAFAAYADPKGCIQCHHWDLNFDPSVGLC